MEKNSQPQSIKGKAFSFQDTKATQKIFQLKKRIRAVCGGTSASKTISILVWHIDYCQTHHNKNADIFSESYPHLEDGVIKDFKNIMIDRGYWEDVRWNESKHFYTFETGTQLKFKSIDKLGKAKGPRRDTLFLNECNNTPYSIYDQLEVRTNDVVWLDWNPSEIFWFNEEIENKIDHDFLRLTYLDCIEALPKSIVQSIESKKGRKNWWRVYGLGLQGETEGKIYSNWKIIDEVPHEARLERYGLDFGYTNDPTAILAVYYLNGGYVLDEITYQKGLLNDQIADIFLMEYDRTKRKALTIADSAEPKSIDELRIRGIVIEPCVKGQGSITSGIDIVQSQQISITKRSLNTIKEYRNYVNKVDKDGRILNEPIDLWNHSMDAIRYALTSIAPVLKLREMKRDMPRYATKTRINPAR